MPNQTMLTAEEVARLARVHPVTVLRAAREGQLPGVRVGRQWRFSRVAVEEFFKIPSAASVAPQELAA